MKLWSTSVNMQKREIKYNLRVYALIINEQLEILLSDQVQDIEDEIELKKIIRSCIVSPDQKVCD